MLLLSKLELVHALQMYCRQSFVLGRGLHRTRIELKGSQFLIGCGIIRADSTPLSTRLLGPRAVMFAGRS